MFRLGGSGSARWGLAGMITMLTLALLITQAAVAGDGSARESRKEIRNVMQAAKDKSRQAARGAVVYKAYCVLCHGAQGQGGSRMTKLHGSDNLGIGNKPLDVYEEIIRKGGAALGRSKYMPAWQDELSAEQIDDVVAYLALVNDPVRRGEVVFKTNCILCHGVNGDGKGRASELFDPPPADLTRSEKNSDYKRMIITLGGEAMGRSPVMPQWGLELADHEIDDVVAYLDTILVANAGEARDQDFVTATPPRRKAARRTKTADEVTSAQVMAHRAERGALVYKAYCVLCHGARGKGGSRMTKLHGALALEIGERPSAYYESIVREGGESLGRSGFMPAWEEELTHEQIGDVVAYLSLLNDPVRRGEVVFKTNCILCHGINGDGKGRAAVLYDPPPADLTRSDKNDDYKRMIITMGGAAMGRSSVMPQWGLQLDEHEIEDVVAYLRTLLMVPGAE